MLKNRRGDHAMDGNVKTCITMQEDNHTKTGNAKATKMLAGPKTEADEVYSKKVHEEIQRPIKDGATSIVQMGLQIRSSSVYLTLESEFIFQA
jgi:hypothetical protein